MESMISGGRRAFGGSSPVASDLMRNTNSNGKNNNNNGNNNK